ncbi:MAG TPA: group 1 truncated hemoglobin [Micromonosporaceae bacterium]
MTTSESLPAEAAVSYYQQLGGAPTIKEAVEQFYARVLGDADLQPYFVSVDVPTLKAHQVRLLSHVLGGPNEYTGRELADAHRSLNITEAHYQRVGEHLLGVLTTMGAGEEIVGAVGGILGSVKDQIVASPQGAHGAS